MLLVELIVVGAQGVYWLWLRDDARDEVVWKACVSPGEE
jgi:hypothetical protein